MSSSKLALILESLVLVYPTVMGVLFFAGVLEPTAAVTIRSPNPWSAAESLFVILGLGAGWYVLIVFLVRGHYAARRIPSAIWLSLAGIAVVSIVAFIFRWPLLAIFGLGILFVPTFIHLSAEVWLRTPPNIRRKGP